MSSSKFSSPKLAYKVPAVCKPPQPPIFPPIVPVLPAQLTAFVSDRDSDPLAPRMDAQTFQLQRMNHEDIYFGKSAETGDRYELGIARIAGTDNWDISLYLYDAYRNPETFFYPARYVDSQKPFDTGLLLDELIPGEDFRMLSITE